MCGIGGVVSLNGNPVISIQRDLDVISALIAHRGPDGSGTWVSDSDNCGFAHTRLAIIDLSEEGAQPMVGADGSVITYNGEIYNYKQLRNQLASGWSFHSQTDTEVILAAYQKWGISCLDHLQGMYAFAIKDKERVFAARDPFGIKPFYYTIVGGQFYFASEMKALLPFLDSIETDEDALAEYLTFQFQIGEQMMFKGIKTLLPGHALKIENGQVSTWRYWDVEHHNSGRSAAEYEEELEALLVASIDAHMNSDVPVGAYVSGGIDSSLMAAMSVDHPMSAAKGFHGKFLEAPAYDESAFAQSACEASGVELHQKVITSDDFTNNIFKTIYHLDQPLAGPGSFPQYMVSEMASEHVKVVLGGQGGDEIFGGYARYMVGYLEQVLGGAIKGETDSQRLPLSLEQILPNLPVLKEYTPLMGQLFSNNLFGPLDERYFKIINRSNDMQAEVDREPLDIEGVFERFRTIFNNEKNTGAGSALDAMTHLDFKCLLPALLQVEDRMSMAHGLEARVPIIDRSIVEFAAGIPSDIKFPGGRLKDMLKVLASKHLPQKVFDRRDKMGFPVPLREWYNGPLGDFVQDIFSVQKSNPRQFFNTDAILNNFRDGGQFSRKTWGLLSLEIWHQVFHDNADNYRKMRISNEIVVPQI